MRFCEHGSEPSVVNVREFLAAT